MDDKVNLAAKFALLDGPYQPGIVGYLNDYKLQIVRIENPFVWHKHEHDANCAAVSSTSWAAQK
jgi:hypothetical protein